MLCSASHPLPPCLCHAADAINYGAVAGAAVAAKVSKKRLTKRNMPLTTLDFLTSGSHCQSLPVLHWGDASHSWARSLLAGLKACLALRWVDWLPNPSLSSLPPQPTTTAYPTESGPHLPNFPVYFCPFSVTISCFLYQAAHLLHPAPGKWVTSRAPPLLPLRLYIAG